jgi:hypothetical protein
MSTTAFIRENPALHYRHGWWTLRDHRSRRFFIPPVVSAPSIAPPARPRVSSGKMAVNRDGGVPTEEQVFRTAHPLEEASAGTVRPTLLQQLRADLFHPETLMILLALLVSILMLQA